jgi:hypothetical protein
MTRCGYCGHALDITKKHVYYRSELQPGRPKVVWCVDPDCWQKDPLARFLLEGMFQDTLEERVCLAQIQARGPDRILAGRDWWGHSGAQRR